MLFGNTMPMLNNTSSSTVRNNTNDIGKAKKLLMSYSSAVLCRSSSSSSSAFSEASAPLSSTSSSSPCSSCSSPPRGYVPRTTEEPKRVSKRQQRWKRWRNESSQPVFVRSSSSSLHSLDSASSNSSGIGTSGAETPPATETTPPLSASTEVQQQHPEQARTSSSLSGKSGMRGSDGLGAAAHYSVAMELEKFEDLSLSHCSLPSGHSTTLPEPVFLLDLSHPILQQFYLQQRLFFRQIYAQQLAALSARLGLAPSSVEETVFDPLVPHQHLGFPPAPPPVGQANFGMFFNSATNPDASSPHCDQALPHDAVLPTDCSPAAMAAPFSSTADEALPQSISPPPSPSVPLAPPTILMMSTAGHTPIHRSRHCSAGSNSAPANNKRSSMNSDEAISRMDVLSERIRDFHYNEDQTHAQLNRKLQLRDQLYYAISPIFPMCGLYIVGSSLNGFGTKRSDLDLCLMITNRDIDQRTDAVVILSSVMRTLESNKIVSEQNLILAKVPILRIKFIGTFHDITVDLNVNNSVAIRNTHLMCYYSSFDWRVRPLVMVVKEWAKRHGINDSACSSFTSYSLVLMVIHFLQCGAQPSVLPNLQQMYPKRFNGRADVRSLNVSLPFEPIPTAMGWQFKEDAALSDLLLGFLRYYAFQFDFDADAISIRMGKKVNRAQVAQNQSPFNTLSQWHCICIEEPFTLSNAAHSVYDERIFQDIKKAFVDSYRELDKQRDLDRFLGTPVEPSTSAQKI